MDQAIPLSQKIYLLGIHPEKGGIRSASITAMNYVVIGSILMELYLDKKIKFDEKRIIVLSTKSDSPLHRFILAKLNEAKSPRKIIRWIQKLNLSHKYIIGEVQKGMFEKRLIRLESKKFLFFKWKKPVITNKQVMYRLVAETDTNIFKGTTVEEDLIFLSLLEPGRLLNRIYIDRKKRKEAKARLKQMMVKNRVSAAVADAISAAQAVAASVAVTTAATS
ncbi:GPP34 family phosphoprotein [Draconibacterium sp. IB214405]|uniref:GOLPH3/VPS74 family protein n=1 Tax=Draconibacterium sp. IB214405 TaxID=3097352 RepID=UPI002A158B61|nr:GPP34 family phosphoprotein [Draconibacterium sp. IB214405]MDX8339155.1 GPP34 family phosphoprotein [Draconibacterium sp. IB214405]